MEFWVFVVLMVIGVVLQAVARQKRRSDGKRPALPPSDRLDQQPRVAVERARAKARELAARRQAPAGRPRVGTTTARQKPATVGGLSGLLAEFRRDLEQMAAEQGGGAEQAGPLGRRAPVSLESAEEVEERESLEVEREDVSYDAVAPVRGERAVVSRGDEADALVQGRARWAEQQAKGLSKADHSAFDQAIRQPTSGTAVAAPDEAQARVERLRHAVIWQEVLGKPLSMR